MWTYVSVGIRCPYCTPLAPMFFGHLTPRLSIQPNGTYCSQSMQITGSSASHGLQRERHGGTRVGGGELVNWVTHLGPSFDSSHRWKVVACTLTYSS